MSNTSEILMEYYQGPDNKKYIIFSGKKYWIPNSATRNALGLAIGNFIPKTKDEIDGIPSGGNIDNVTSVHTIRSENNLNPVYAIFNYPYKHKRHIPNPLTFNALGLSWDSIETVSQEYFDGIPTEDELNRFEDWEPEVKEEVEKRYSESLGSGKILVRFNVLGPFLENDVIQDILHFEGELNIENELNSKISSLNDFFQRSSVNYKEEELRRYIEVTPPGLFLNIFPHEKTFTERIVDTLTSAKRMYCLGEYLATIALCGVIGEMMAILIWKTINPKFNGVEINESKQKLLFRKSIDRLEQSRRIDILEGMNAISPYQKQLLCRLKDTRNRYLHHWEPEESNPSLDAMNIFKDALGLFKDFVQISYTKDRVSMNPALMKLIQVSN